jgi:PIN domain nuclease of toxin-antitoxin system
VDLGLDRERPEIQRSTAAPVILLDTNALIWLEQGRPRARRLADGSKRLHVSPANLLELQFLLEAGRLRLGGLSVSDLAQRGPWLLDDPPAAAWFDTALTLGWTRDPFDRLLVAHARLRGWRLATGDTALSERLLENERISI